MSGPATPLTPPFDELLTHVEWVRRLARRLVVDAGRADDVAQETWLAALEHPPRHLRNLKHWLALVVRNAARKAVRGEATRARHEEQAGAGYTGTPSSVRSGGTPAADEILARAQLQRRVVDAVLELPEPYRTTILARWFEDLGPDAIAQTLHVPVETVKTRLKRGHALLRERLAGELSSDGRSWQAALLPLLLPPGGPISAPPVLTLSTAATIGVTCMASLVKPAAALVIAVLVPVVAWKLMDRAPPPAQRNPSTSSALPDSPPPVMVLPAPVVAEITPEPPPAETATVKAPVATTGTLHGVVRDERGAVIAGATVLLAPSTSDAGRSMTFPDRPSILQQWLRPAAAGQDLKPELRLSRTSTDADGTFEYTDLDAGGSWTLAAMKDPIGLGSEAAIRMAGSPPHAEVDVTLTDGVVIHGVVRDRSGNPLGAIGVGLRGAPSGAAGSVVTFDDFISACDFIRTNEQGEYRSLPLPWTRVVLHLSAFGRSELADAELPAALVPEGMREWRIDAVLDSASTRRGHLILANGSPARIAETVLPKLVDAERLRANGRTLCVVALSEDPRVVPWRITSLPYRVNDNGMGSADVAYGQLDAANDSFSIPVRSSKLRFIAVVARNQLLGVAEIPATAEGPDIVVDPTLLPEASLVQLLHIELRDALDHAPLDGVSVAGTQIGPDPSGRMIMRHENFSPWPGVPPASQDLLLASGSWTLFLLKDKFAMHYLQVDVKAGANPRTLSIEMQRADATVTISLQDGNHAPVRDAAVRLYRMPEMEATGPLEGPKPTNDQGMVQIPELAEGDYLVVATARGFAPATAVVMASSEGGQADLVLARGIPIAVKLRKSNGAEAEGARLRLLDADGRPLLDASHPTGDRWTMVRGIDLHLVEGHYTLQAEIPGQWSGSTTFDAAPDLEVVVELAPVR